MDNEIEMMSFGGMYSSAATFGKEGETGKWVPRTFSEICDDLDARGFTVVVTGPNSAEVY